MGADGQFGNSGQAGEAALGNVVVQLLKCLNKDSDNGKAAIVQA